MFVFVETWERVGPHDVFVEWLTYQPAWPPNSCKGYRDCGKQYPEPVYIPRCYEYFMSRCTFLSWS